MGSCNTGNQPPRGTKAQCDSPGGGGGERKRARGAEGTKINENEPNHKSHRRIEGIERRHDETEDDEQRKETQGTCCDRGRQPGDIFGNPEQGGSRHSASTATASTKHEVSARSMTGINNY
jgi:hypothetical protein